MRTMTRLRRQLRQAHLLRRWWVWLLACWLVYGGTIATLRYLLDDYIVVSSSHDDGPRGSRRVVVYISVKTDFATGADRVVVWLGRSLLGPELAAEGWVRTHLMSR